MCTFDAFRQSPPVRPEPGGLRNYNMKEILHGVEIKGIEDETGERRKVAVRLDKPVKTVVYL